MENLKIGLIYSIPLLMFTVGIFGCYPEPLTVEEVSNNVTDINDISGIHVCGNSVGGGSIPHGGGECGGRPPKIVKISTSGLYSTYDLSTCSLIESRKIEYRLSSNMFQDSSGRALEFNKNTNVVTMKERYIGTCFSQCQFQAYTENACKVD